MSPILDLVRDYSRFVTAFFEVIGTSAPHIYHSALPLSPQTSIVCKLYKQYARPLARVVRGLPLSWEPVVATVRFEDFCGEAIWSPCNKWIAVTRSQSVEILDAVTLSRLSTFKCSQRHFNRQLSFSPDSRLLTLINYGDFLSWDVQTGGILGETPTELDASGAAFSFAHSEDGKMVSIARAVHQDSCAGDENCHTIINTYNFPSRTFTGPFCAAEEYLIRPIWTHGEYLQFATIAPGLITTWEVEFTLTSPPVVVESFPIPDETFNGKNFLFLPSLSRLAFTPGNGVWVWDVKASKLLLTSQLVQSQEYIGSAKMFLSKEMFLPKFSFSSDGCFFACLDTAGVVHIWKDSPAGYVLHQQVHFPPKFPYNSQGPRLSPNGKSIFIPIHGVIHLWHTRNQVLSLPSISTGDVFGGHFILKISPNGRFAASGQQGGNTVTVLDLQSGNQRCVIATGVKIDCLGITESTVAVAGNEMVVTWNLLGRDSAFNASINDSIQITELNYSLPSYNLDKRDYYLSLSPDLSLIAIASSSENSNDLSLKIHDVSTGVCHVTVPTDIFSQPIFTQDRCEVWVFFDDQKSGWGIVEDSKSGVMELKPREKTVHPSAAFFWESLCGYQVMDDGWVLSPTQKRLLWLPHHWRSAQKQREWSGQFLGLSPSGLSEVIILEFLE